MNFIRKGLALVKSGREEIMVALDMMDESEMTVYKTGPAEMIPDVHREWRMPSSLEPQRPKLSLVPKPFDEDNRMHQRWLSTVMEDRKCEKNTQAIMDKMATVGIELSRAQAFGALTQWIESLDIPQGGALEL